jgi:hypothetical protein
LFYQQPLLWTSASYPRLLYQLTVEQGTWWAFTVYSPYSPYPSPSRATPSMSESGANDIPRDAKVVEEILSSMDVDEWDPKVVHQLLEFMYRTEKGPWEGWLCHSLERAEVLT